MSLTVTNPSQHLMLNYKPIPLEILFHYNLTYTSFYLILWSFKLSQNISYQWEERKRKINVKTAVSLLNLKTSLKFFFLSMIKCWKLILCIWNRRLCEVLNSQTAFWLIIARHWPENSLISLKKQFSAKFWGVNGLKNRVWETADHYCGQWNGKGKSWKRLLYVLITSCSTSVA